MAKLHSGLPSGQLQLQAYSFVFALPVKMSAEAAEPQMPQLTPDQAKLIQDTWKLVAEDLEGAGMVMFMK